MCVINFSVNTHHIIQIDINISRFRISWRRQLVCLHWKPRMKFRRKFSGNSVAIRFLIFGMDWLVRGFVCIKLFMLLLSIRGMRWQGFGENYIMRSLMIYTVHPVLFGWWNLEEWDGRGTRHVWGRGEAYTGFWCGNLKERDHLVDPGIDGRIILRWIFRKWDVGLGTALSSLMIRTGGGHLWMR